MAKTGRYSGLIRPISYFVDISILLLLALQFEFDLILNLAFYLYVIITWILLSLKSNFYEVYRYTKVTKIISLTTLQFIIFTLIVFAFFGYFYEYGRESSRIFLYLGKSFGLIFLIKISLYYLLKKYRKEVGGNFRITVIIGKTKRSQQLYTFFKDNPGYGYKCLKVFDVDHDDFDLDQVYEFILSNEVDEIYCSLAEVPNKKLNAIINFADNNLKVLKFLPDNKDVYSRKMNYEYYGFFTYPLFEKNST